MSNPAENEPIQKATLLELLGRDDGEGDTALTEYAASVHPADLASLLDELEILEDKTRVFNVLDTERASEVARKLDGVTRDAILAEISDPRIAAMIELLDTDDATDLVAGLPEERQQTLLRRTSPQIRRDVEELLTYDDDSAGGIMKTEVAHVRKGTTVRGITEYIRRGGEEFHDIHSVFVTDDAGRLVGLAPLRRLILSSDSALIEDIMETDLATVRVDVDQEQVAHLFEKYDLLSIPVVDYEERLVGRITVDDIVDIIEEEATEDMLRLAGVAAETVTIDGPAQGIRSRLPWLALNLVTASASALTISMFEGTIQVVAVAAALMTVVASQGGNAGVQTMTLVVRGLALNEFETGHVLRILRRELLIAMVNGSVLGLLSGSIVYLWRADLQLSLVLAGAMLINLVIAALFGTLVPLGLKLLRVDPAVSSSVLVTAVTDILGFFVFLGLLSAALG